MTSLTRGPLSPRVYWRRRVLLIGSALLLVFAFARLLGGGSDATSGPDRATQVAASPTATASSPTTTPTTTPRNPVRRKSHAPVLATPVGTCADEDISVTPTVPKATAGREVFLVLELRTIAAEACTWQVSPETLTLKITSGEDDIWSSRECPHALQSRSVVVRRAVSTTVGVTWNARRSDEDCRRTDWALPGYYHVVAAALAGEPADAQFELGPVPRQVITRSPSPKQEPHKPARR